MSLPADLSLRDATLDDLPAIGALRESVGWGVQEWALHAVIGHDDARCLVAVTPDGDIAGVGSGVVYGPIGFVGNMVVAEAHRRRGLGSAILAAITGFLDAAGCRRLELNATSEGRPLYERHGFRSIGSSHSAGIPRRAGLAPHRALRIRERGGNELDRIAEYDLPRFGGNRRRILAAAIAAPDARCLVAERDGAIAGYGVLRGGDGRLGPLLADEPSVAASLVCEAFARAPGVDVFRVNLPPGNRRGTEWLRSLGLALEAWDGRMARGAELPRRAETIYGMAVGALG